LKAIINAYQSAVLRKKFYPLADMIQMEVPSKKPFRIKRPNAKTESVPPKQEENLEEEKFFMGKGKK